MRVPQALPKAVGPSLGTGYTSLEDGLRMRNCPFRSQDEVKDSSYWDPRPTKRFEKSYCSLILGQAPRAPRCRTALRASWTPPRLGMPERRALRPHEVQALGS